MVKVTEYLLLCDLCKSAGKITTFKTEKEARDHLAKEHGLLDFFSLIPVIEEVKAPEKKARDVEESVAEEPVAAPAVSPSLVEQVTRKVLEVTKEAPKLPKKSRAKVLDA